MEIPEETTSWQGWDSEYGNEADITVEYIIWFLERFGLKEMTWMLEDYNDEMLDDFTKFGEMMIQAAKEIKKRHGSTRDT